MIAQVVNSLVLKVWDIAIFAVKFSIFSKSFLYMKLSHISEIGTGTIFRYTGKTQGICK